uniref:Uncharacterized protein n=1 Tax=Triticum urartu TaxID=4572 RepID=A0A8R7V5R3_TRIUA
TSPTPLLLLLLVGLPGALVSACGRTSTTAALICDAREPLALLRSGYVETTVATLIPLPRSTSSSSTQDCQVPLRTDIAKYHEDTRTTTVDEHFAKFHDTA